MGRKHLLKSYGMSYADLEKLYRKFGTVKKLAERLGVSERTVKNWMHEGGIAGIKHGTRVREVGTSSALRKWINEHPGEKLPRNERKISEITGVPYSSVHSYFYRRRKRLLEWLKALPPLEETNAVLTADDGTFLPVKNIEYYDFKLDRYSLTLKVYGRRKTGSLFEHTTSVRKYAKLVTPAAPATQDPSGQERP